MQTIKVIGLTILGLVLLVVLWAVGQTLFVAGTAEHSAHQIVKKTLSSSNVIYNYEWFQQEYRDGKAAKSKLTQAKTALQDTKTSLPANTANWSFYQQQTWQEQEDTVLGLQQQLSNIAAKYNAHSAEVNRQIFKTGNLPQRLSYGK